MLFWIDDNAALLYLLFGIAAFSLAVAWWMTRERRYLVPLGVAVGLIALVWLIDRLVVSDSEQIRHNVFAMRDAVLEGKPGELLQHIAREFEFQGMDRQRFAEYAQRSLPRKPVHDAHIFNYETEEVSRAEGTARVVFRVRASANLGEGLFLIRLDFVREGDQWKLRRCGVFRPIADTDQPIQLPLP